MNFKDLDIKACYESGVNDIVEEFYEPTLSCAKQYDRIAGFFCSSTLAVAARGLSEFIKHNGKMRLITSPILDPDDYDIIKKVSSGDNVTLEELKFDLDNIITDFEANHVQALGWMLEHGLLEMKLAIVAGDDGTILTRESLLQAGLFHQKVGVMKDHDGNLISFSGSINETAAAWINNDEEFKVFNNWEGNTDYLQRDVNRFETLWNNQKKRNSVVPNPPMIC